MLDDVDEALIRTDIGVNIPPIWLHPHRFLSNRIHLRTLVSMAVLPPYFPIELLPFPSAQQVSIGCPSAQSSLRLYGGRHCVDVGTRLEWAAEYQSINTRRQLSRTCAYRIPY